MEEKIIEGFPAFLNEVNEMTLWSVLGLLVIYMIVREVLRFRYRKQARAMVESVINGEGDPEQTLSGKSPGGNPHGLHDPMNVATWLIEEFRAYRGKTDRRLERMETRLGRIEGMLQAQQGGE